MKKTMQFLLAVTLLIISTSSSNAQSIPKDSLYLGQTPPGFTPKVFQLPISSGLYAAERIAISSDGTEIYYTELNGYPISVSRIKSFHYKNARWNGPFVEMSNYIAPALSMDGKRLFYENGSNTTFSSTRSGTKWSASAIFLNTSKMMHYLHVTKSGNYYLTSNPLLSNTGDIAKLLINSVDTTIITLGNPINLASNGFDFFISPDESYIIRVIKSKGTGDLFISYHKADGGWTNPKTLGTQVNHPQGWEWGPYVTNDNKYLFFTRQLNSLDIYWVRVDNLIDSLKHTNFIPYLKNKISNQSATVGNSFHFVIPENTFIDDDANNTLTFTAALSDGSPFPSWLSFDSNSQTFSGTPHEVGLLKIKVTVTDNEKTMASCEFEIQTGK